MHALQLTCCGDIAGKVVLQILGLLNVVDEALSDIVQGRDVFDAVAPGIVSLREPLVRGHLFVLGGWGELRGDVEPVVGSSGKLVIITGNRFY